MLEFVRRMPKYWLIIATLVGLAGCANGPTLQKASPERNIPEPDIKTPKEPIKPSIAPVLKSDGRLDDDTPVVSNDIWQRIRDGYQLSHEQHPAIDELVQWFGENHSVIAESSKRATPLLYYIVESVEAQALPTELALIPLLESGYRVHARSRFGAVGPWQFMPATGRQYGLHRGAFVDQRRDIELSTQASLAYLKNLHRQFNGDWLLAIAAYNSGPGNVRKALEGSHQSFWDIAAKLPNETKNYVPKLLAAARIIGNPPAHNQQVFSIPNEPFFETVNVSGPVDFDVLDTLPGWDKKLFRRLNGNLTSSYFGGTKKLGVRVPQGMATPVLKRIADAGPPEIPASTSYTIRRGDTLGGISTRFNVSITELRKINGLHGSHIRAGKEILIPVSNSTAHLDNKPSTTLRRHVVQPGDNFWTLGRRYGLSARTIANHNGHAINKTLYPGQLLLIPKPNSSPGNELSASLAAYIVERGDSLWSIARRFNIRLTDLKRWNPLVSGKLLQPGQKLVVQAP